VSLNLFLEGNCWLHVGGLPCQFFTPLNHRGSSKMGLLYANLSPTHQQLILIFCVYDIQSILFSYLFNYIQKAFLANLSPLIGEQVRSICWYWKNHLIKRCIDKQGTHEHSFLSQQALILKCNPPAQDTNRLARNHSLHQIKQLSLCFIYNQLIYKLFPSHKGGCHVRWHLMESCLWLGWEGPHSNSKVAIKWQLRDIQS